MPVVGAADASFAPIGVNPRDPRGRRVEQSQAVKTFEELFAELSEKVRTRPDGSGTVAALDGGVHGLGKKILEEARPEAYRLQREAYEEADKKAGPLFEKRKLEVVKVSPEMREKLIALGLEPEGNTPAEFHAQLGAELAKWARVIKTARITVE